MIGEFSFLTLWIEITQRDLFAIAGGLLQKGFLQRCQRVFLQAFESDVFSLLCLLNSQADQVDLIQNTGFFFQSVIAFIDFCQCFILLKEDPFLQLL